MDRRRFLTWAATLPLVLAGSPRAVKSAPAPRARPRPSSSRKPKKDPSNLDHVTLFLGGDVMTGRGIDQVLRHPSDPRLFEPYVRTATRYVELAEAKNGPIQGPIEYPYVWGDALAELDRMAPDVRIINLETSVTKSDRHWRGKGVHYRMHPENVPCIATAGIDCCVLANNHVIDWGFTGLRETLDTLEDAGIATAGAGLDAEDAAAPAVLEMGTRGRVLVFGFGTKASGIPGDWAAQADRPGVNLLDDLSPATVRHIAERIGASKSEGDVVVASIHWGSNWGYQVPAAQREFAHRLIDEAGVDVVHGHSSHHFRGIEIHHDRPILYGCGDLLNDYEGISGQEEYRADLVLLYFPVILSSTGRLVRFWLSPMRIRQFRLNRPSTDEVEWIRETLNREGERYETWVEAGPDGTLALRWPRGDKGGDKRGGR
jgi:poly-gamma-glutamate synthesis protein (capsule biosynthesis protein)